MNLFGGFSGISPLDLAKPWKEVNYCAIDLETTGLDLKNDEIISYGTVKIHHGRIENALSSYQTIKPIRHPSESSIKIHGIRQLDLENAPALKDSVAEIALQLTGHVVIAHAAWIERAFLTNPLKSTGSKFPKHLLDTAALARACGFADEAKGNEPSLEYLARTINLPVYSPHNSLGDAMTTAVLFLALASQLERIRKSPSAEAMTLKELLEVSKEFSA